MWRRISACARSSLRPKCRTSTSSAQARQIPCVCRARDSRGKASRSSRSDFAFLGAAMDALRVAGFALFFLSGDFAGAAGLATAERFTAVFLETVFFTTDFFAPAFLATTFRAPALAAGFFAFVRASFVFFTAATKHRVFRRGSRCQLEAPLPSCAGAGTVVTVKTGTPGNTLVD